MRCWLEVLEAEVVPWAILAAGADGKLAVVEVVVLKTF